MAKCCFHCMRVIVILLNLLFVLIGCAILGLAIFLYVDKTITGIKQNMENKLMIDIMLFSAIGIGGITIIVSTFGCCGAYHESECLLGTYFFCLFVIVAAEIALGVLCYLKVDENTVKEQLTKAIKSSIDMYMKDGTNAGPPEHLKQMQSMLYCCGANGYSDYVGSALGSVLDFSLDSTKGAKLVKACASDSESSAAGVISLLKMRPGCTDKIISNLNANKLYVLVACAVVAAIEILAMIIAMSLCCTVRRMESGYIGVST